MSEGLNRGDSSIGLISDPIFHLVSEGGGGGTYEVPKRSGSLNRDWVEAWSLHLARPTDVVPPSFHPNRVEIGFRCGSVHLIRRKNGGNGGLKNS